MNSSDEETFKSKFFTGKIFKIFYGKLCVVYTYAISKIDKIILWNTTPNCIFSEILTRNESILFYFIRFPKIPRRPFINRTNEGKEAVSLLTKKKGKVLFFAIFIHCHISFVEEC